VNLRRVNKKVIECLIKAGALDGYGFHRAQLMAGYARAVEWAERAREEKEVGQSSLFALHEDVQEKLEFPTVALWRRLELLEHEKDVLGFYLSGHPLDGIESLMKPFVNSTLGGLASVPHKQEVTLAGLVGTFREIITKKGTRMAFVGLEDLTGSAELVIFPDLYAKVEMMLKSESPLLVTAIVEHSESGAKLIAQNVITLEAQASKSQRLVLTLSSRDQDVVLTQLSQCLKRHQGTVSVNLRLQVPHEVMLQVQNPVGIKPTREFFDDLYTVLGRSDFELV
jgi:DNA polymerase-3 subunit alpha